MHSCKFKNSDFLNRSISLPISRQARTKTKNILFSLEMSNKEKEDLNQTQKRDRFRIRILFGISEKRVLRKLRPKTRDYLTYWSTLSGYGNNCPANFISVTNFDFDFWKRYKSDASGLHCKKTAGKLNLTMVDRYKLEPIDSK